MTIISESDRFYLVDHGNFQIAWLKSRGIGKFNFKAPSEFFVMGIRGQGKSNFLEFMATRYLEAGGGVLDLNCAKDSENLAWLRSPYVKKNRVLLLKGEDVRVKSKWDVLTYTKFDPSLLDEYKIILNVPAFYTTLDEMVLSVRAIAEKLMRRNSWNFPTALIAREAQDIFPSRIRAQKSQELSKGMATYMIREARHSGIAMLLDSLKWKAIDDDIRDAVRFTVIKALGVTGLPDRLRWIYRFFRASFLQRVPVNRFIISDLAGPLGYGTIPFCEWHKTEAENLVQKFNFEIEYPEAEKVRVNVATAEGHSEVIRLYDQGLTTTKIAGTLGISTFSVYQCLHAHNDYVLRDGQCEKCAEAGNTAYLTKPIIIRKKGGNYT
jgi:hypothetical protein